MPADLTEAELKGLESLALGGLGKVDPGVLVYVRADRLLSLIESARALRRVEAALKQQQLYAATLSGESNPISRALDALEAAIKGDAGGKETE